MTTATYGRRPGWVTFAAVLMFAVAFTRIISAINYFGNGAQINDLAGSTFAQHLWVWGAWDLCLAAIGLIAGLSLLHGGGFGRFLAYVWGTWVIVQSFLIISQAPWYSVAMITLAVLVMWGLATTSDWAEESR